MVDAKALVRDFMTTNVIFAHIEHSFMQTCRLLFELNIHHLPILDDQKKLVGIISSNDMLKAFSYEVPIMGKADEQSLNNKFSILDIMTTNPITISVEETIEKAAQLFVDENIQSLPVVEDGQMVGIFTSSDLIKAIANH